MTDPKEWRLLAEEARARVGWGSEDDWEFAKGMAAALMDAAEEVERLREALRKIIAVLPDIERSVETEMRLLARTALGDAP
jgi:hypothetical protein